MPNQLFQEVTELTKLDQTSVSKELTEIVNKVGSCPESLTIEQLREAMLLYLNEVFLEATQPHKE